jgi:hypothetical protein
VDEGAEEAVASVPTPSEAADHLTHALLWMETESLDPALLLVVRDILSLAKQARPVDPVSWYHYCNVWADVGLLLPPAGKLHPVNLGALLPEKEQTRPVGLGSLLPWYTDGRPLL